MSESQEKRRSDALALLERIFIEIADQPIDTTLLDPTAPRYIDVKPTSWDELSAEGLLQKLNDSNYVLTPAGWAEAFARAGLSTEPEFLRRIGLLAQALKRPVKGRQTPSLLSFDEVVSSSALPPGWVFNVIDSHLISRLQGRKDASWFQNARGRLVEIPRDFGLDAIDLFADLRAENERLREEAEYLQEQVREFSCPSCGAPLTTIGRWEHQYGDEEVREFACGRTEGAPYGDIPCTKDPDFPSFEDFKLTTKQEGHGWLCFASHIPKKRYIGSVHLPTTMGKTEEEAKTAMQAEYKRRAKRWP